jgi:hypothetical protein
MLGMWFREAAVAGRCDGHAPAQENAAAWVIYFTRVVAEEIWLLLIYAKSVRDNIPGHLIKAVREEIENG